MLSLTSVGLIYDVTGVLILGYAFLFTPVSAFFLNSQTFYGGNSGELESRIAGRTDGIIGTLLLFVGFILQLLGANSYGPDAAGVALLGFLALFVAGYLLFLRKKAIQIQLKRAKDFEESWKKGS